MADTAAIMLKEAFELQSLQANTTLLEHGLHMGLIEQTSSGQMTIEQLNIKLMSGSQIVRSLLLELLMRMGMFVSGTSLVKLAIDSHIQDPDVENGIRALYGLSVIGHQVVNFDRTSLRTINRFLMSIAIILFSLTFPYNTPCVDMVKFKHRIRHRLSVDYYLWCLMFAMDLILTCSSPLHINLEREYGIELNISHAMLSSYCVIHLSRSMCLIGCGSLTPLIIGTPLLFLDAGDDMSVAKFLFLFLYYLCFWCSDWRELVDWNHVMLCRAGICRILSTEEGNLRQVVRKAKHKFEDWLVEEGLNDDGWCILLEPPPITQGTETDEDDSEDDEFRDNGRAENMEVDAGNGLHQHNHRHQQTVVDYSDRVIYLSSRNPLLTSLAFIMLIVWK